MSRLPEFDDRASAAFVDVILIFCLVGAWSFGIAALGPHPRVQQAVAEAAFYATVCLVLPPLLEARWGATPGKHLCGLAVVGADGRPPRFRDAFLRNILKYGIAPILIVQAATGRAGSHDRIGGTRVVRTQTGRIA